PFPRATSSPRSPPDLQRSTNMRFPSATCAAAVALLPAVAFAAPQPASNRPLMAIYDAPGITRACDQGIARAQAMIGEMEAKKGAGAIFDEWNGLAIAIEDVANPVFLQGSVSPDKAVRDAAEPCLTKYTTLGANLFQNERLFARVNAAQP